MHHMYIQIVYILFIFFNTIRPAHLCTMQFTFHAGIKYTYIIQRDMPFTI